MDRFKASKAQLKQLLEEVDNICPLCGHRIFQQKSSGRCVTLFEIAHIYPHNATSEQSAELKGLPRAKEIESIDNVILLCRNCHKAQDAHTTVSEYMKLYNLKRNLSERRNAKQAIANLDIEPQIKKVLKGLTTLDSNDDIELSYNPLYLNRKLINQLLLDDVRSKVTSYYKRIKCILQEMDYETTGLSDIIAQEIRLAFSKTAMQFNIKGEIRDTSDENVQEEIFNLMVKWLSQKTETSETACRIVIAFYIQDCEVFHEITK